MGIRPKPSSGSPSGCTTSCRSGAPHMRTISRIRSLIPCLTSRNAEADARELTRAGEHSTRRLRAFSIAILVPLLLGIGACSRHSPVSGSAAPSASKGAAAPLTGSDLTGEPGTVFDVKYSANLLRIDTDRFIHALRSVSADHTVYIFDKSSDVARSLKPGKVFLVPGLTLQKVIATAEDGPDLIVGAGEAPLTEAIQEGTIKWTHDVNFQQAARQQNLAFETHAPPRAGLLADLGP